MMKDAQFFLFLFSHLRTCVHWICGFHDDLHGGMPLNANYTYCFNWYVFSVCLVLDYDCVTIGWDGSKILCGKGSMRLRMACGTSICTQLHSIPFRPFHCRRIDSISKLYCSRPSRWHFAPHCSVPFWNATCMNCGLFSFFSFVNDSGCIPRATAVAAHEARHRVCIVQTISQPTLMFAIYYCL